MSYREVFDDFLINRKKFKLQTDKIRAEKQDKLQLINLDQGGQEITEKCMIEANTKVVIRRLPMKVSEAPVIEVEYN